MGNNHLQALALEKQMELPPLSVCGETIVDKSCVLDGKMTLGRFSRIRGKIKGEIVSKGMLIIDEGGRVEGAVEGENIEVQGSLKGNVVAHGKVDIKSSAKVRGDVSAPALNIEVGAAFSGKCDMPQRLEIKRVRKRRTAS